MARCRGEVWVRPSQVRFQPSSLEALRSMQRLRALGSHRTVATIGAIKRAGKR